MYVCQLFHRESFRKFVQQSVAIIDHIICELDLLEFLGKILCTFFNSVVLDALISCHVVHLQIKHFLCKSFFILLNFPLDFFLSHYFFRLNLFLLLSLLLWQYWLCFLWLFYLHKFLVGFLQRSGFFELKFFPIRHL